jgi:hypothetical protein
LKFGDYVLWFPKGEKTHLGKFKKRWFGPFRVQYCLPNNIVFLVFVNNFEPNPILVNVNKLKPYRYVDQTLKGIQSSQNQKSLESINFYHKKKEFDEDLEDERTSEIINIHQIVTLEETLVNLMNQQAMILLKNHNNIVSQPIDYGSDNSITSKQFSIDMMIQHKTKKICNVDNTKSSEETGAIFTKLLGQQA